MVLVSYLEMSLIPESNQRGGIYYVQYSVYINEKTQFDFTNWVRIAQEKGAIGYDTMLTFV